MDSASISRYQTWDVWLGRLLVLTGIVGFAVSGSESIWIRLAPAGSTGPAIGEVARARGGVRIRPGNSVVWRDVLTASEGVADQDAVFTAHDAGAALKFGRDVEVELMPDALVVVRAPMAQVPALEVRRGAIRVNLPQREGAALQVLAGARRLSVAPGATSAIAEIRLDEGGLVRVTSDSPGVEVRSLEEAEAAPVTLRPGDQVVTDLDSLTPLRTRRKRARAEGPSPGTRIFANAEDGEATAQFRWSGVKAATVELKGDAEYTARARGEDGKAELSLKPGVYRWRVDEAGEPDADAEWHELRVVGLAPPSVSGPVDGLELRVSDSRPLTVEFAWPRPEPGIQVELEAEGGANHQLTPSRSRSAGAVLEVSAGDYRWRVRTVAAHLSSSWSDWSRFSVVENGVINSRSGEEPKVHEAPNVAQTPKAVVRSIELSPVTVRGRLWGETRSGKVPMTLRWKAVPEVETYEVRVFGSSGEVVSVNRVAEPRLALDLPSGGEGFEYEVSCDVPGSGRLESRRVPIQIDLIAPEPVKPASRTKVPLGEVVLLTWETTAFARSYSLEFARDAGFGEIVRRANTEKNYSAFNPPSAGTYFWRVMGVNGVKRSAWSRSFELRVE